MTRTLRTLIALALLTAAAHANAATITGTVTNKTHNHPAAGDTVVLIQLAQGMQETTRTTTDAHGRYALDIPAAGMHLVRVTHDKANYFGPAPPNTDTVDIDVYDAAAHVTGISEEADVMRIETDAGNANLHVVENFFIKNDSAPPRTQFSNSPFDFYLPAGAIIAGSAALGPGSMPIKAAPVPLSDAPGHYTFLFPIRPGETRFQVTYTLPYSGNFAFAPRPMLATDTIAIMMPKSMAFAPAAGSPFASVNDPSVNAQTFVARTLPADKAIPFTVSGSGQLPRDSQNADSNGSSQSDSSAQSGSAQPGSAANDTRPGGGLGTPIDTPDPLSKYKWWIVGGLLLLMAGIAGFLVSKPSAAAPDTSPMPVAPLTGRSTLDALKEELFTLETDRLSGKMDEAEYAEHKTALETILKRALKRG